VHVWFFKADKVITGKPVAAQVLLSVEIKPGMTQFSGELKNRIQL
jgi:hypothetical protein